jgi:hypothetical protein
MEARSVAWTSSPCGSAAEGLTLGTSDGRVDGSVAPADSLDPPALGSPTDAHPARLVTRSATTAILARVHMMVENIPSMEKRQRTDGDVPSSERDATPAEARALAHPLRLRILRLCIDEALTNRELALRLERDPGTVLYHVRRLVDLGFLKPEPMRRAASGHLEQPYRITGKSWMLRVSKAPSYSTAVLDAVRDELVEAGPRSPISTTRLGVRLTDSDIAELRRRLDALADDFAARDDPKGTPVGMLLLAHRRRD